MTCYDILQPQENWCFLNDTNIYVVVLNSQECYQWTISAVLKFSYFAKLRTVCMNGVRLFQPYRKSASYKQTFLLLRLIGKINKIGELDENGWK